MQLVYRYVNIYSREQINNDKGGKIMENILKEIQQIMESNGLDCTLENAQQILNTTFETSNIVKKAVLNSIKTQYDLR